MKDEPFLRLTSEGTRRLRANELAALLVAAPLMSETGVKGAIAQAVRIATARRAAEVVPAGTAALNEQLPQLAETLSSEPDFAAATTKQARERCAPDLLMRTDPVVLPAPLIAPLLAAALATQAGHQPVLAM